MNSDRWDVEKKKNHLFTSSEKVGKETGINGSEQKKAASKRAKGHSKEDVGDVQMIVKKKAGGQ